MGGPGSGAGTQQGGSSDNYSLLRTGTIFLCLTTWMGRDVHPNMALDYRILNTILSNIEKDLLEGHMNRKQKQYLLLWAFYMLICFTASLRGNKDLMMEVQELLQHAHQGKDVPEDKRHIAVLLLGEFKSK
eukprot:6603965-Ditylum_brightwellii.AAC.1